MTNLSKNDLGKLIAHVEGNDGRANIANKEAGLKRLARAMAAKRPDFADHKALLDAATYEAALGVLALNTAGSFDELEAALTPAPAPAADDLELPAALKREIPPRLAIGDKGRIIVGNGGRKTRPLAIVNEPAPAKPAPTTGSRRKDAAIREAAARGDLPGVSRRAAWAAREAAAARGELPEPPALAGDSNAPYRVWRDQVTALAEAGDVMGLRDKPLKTYDSSWQAISRYRDLCVLALETRSK